MGPFNLPSAELVWQQVNRDNPQLPYPVNGKNVVLLQGPFTTGLGDTGRNTRIIVNGQGAQYSGKTTLWYDRIALGSLFGGWRVPVTIPYHATTLREIIASVSEACGVLLTADDLNTPDMNIGAVTVNTANLNIAVKAECPAYTGVLPIVWTREPPSLVDLYADTETTAWELPDIYTTVYQLDWTPYTSQLTALATNAGLTRNSAGVINFVGALAAWSGIPFTIGTAPNDDPYDLYGYIASRDTNPGINPEMRGEFNGCLKLTPPAALLNMRRPLYLHYSRKDSKVYLAQEADLQRYANAKGIETPSFTGPVVANTGKPVLARTPLAVAADTLLGTPYGSYMLGNVYWPRLMQHAYPTQALYEAAAAKNLLTMALCTLVTFASTTVPGLARNGYTSLAATSTQGWKLTQFVYYDSDAGGYKTYDPFSKTAPVNWYPPYV